MIWIAGFALLALELINASARFKQSHGSLWSLFLAIGAFLYLWWLASLLFDLVFVWHRYVQADGALQFLRKEIRPSDFHASGDDDRPDGGAAAELKIPPSTPGPEVSRPHEG